MAFYCATGWDRPGSAAGCSVPSRGRGATASHCWRRVRRQCCAQPAARLAWLRLVRETCEANGILWALWGYDDVMGFDLPRPPENRPQLDRSVLAALDSVP